VEIAKRGHRVLAGDISLKMLKILSGKLEQAPERSIIPCRLNAYSLPLLDRSVDAAMAMQLLPFVGDPPLVLGEIKRVLKPGGMFITHGPGETQSPKDDVVGEINGKLRRYCDEALKRRGVNMLKPPGWTNRQIWENLPKLFRTYSLVERDDLVFRFAETPRWFLQRLGSRYTLFQMGFDQGIHNEVMREVRERVAAEYGRDFEELEQEYCETHPLSVCRD